jgi:hypothetical protein
LNVIPILIFLLGPCFGLASSSLSESVGGRIGIFGVFLFTGRGHFMKRQAMAEMVPGKMPERGELRSSTARHFRLPFSILGKRAWARP